MCAGFTSRGIERKWWAERSVSALGLATQEQEAGAHALHAGKTTKCQGWFWETAAGAPVAVGMETAVELGCKQRPNTSLKMSKHLRGVRAVPGPDNRQPSCPAHKPGWKWLCNLSCKVLWPSVCSQIVFCFHTGVTSTEGLLCPFKPASNRSRPVY